MTDGIAKDEMERANINSFLHTYNQSILPNLKIACQRECPDFLLANEFDEVIFGAEVTLAILDSTHGLLARKTFSRDNAVINAVDFADPTGKAVKNKMGSVMDTVRGNSAALAPKINERIRSKCQMASKYEFDGELILVIGLTEHVFGINSVNWKDIRIPNDTPFKEIWVNVFNCARDNQDGIVCVYPKTKVISQ